MVMYLTFICLIRPDYSNHSLLLFIIGAGGRSDISDDGKKLSKKSKNKKSKKVKDRDRSRSIEPISPPPLKKHKSDKNGKSPPDSLSPVSEDDNYAGVQMKIKKVGIFRRCT